MRCTPVRCTPMRYTPIRCTPMRSTPARYASEVVLSFYIREVLLEIVRSTNSSSRTLSFSGESFSTILSSATPSSPPLSSPPSPRRCSISVAQRERKIRIWSPSRRRYLQWQSGFGQRLPPSRPVTRPQSQRWRISGWSWQGRRPLYKTLYRGVSPLPSRLRGRGCCHRPGILSSRRGRDGLSRRRRRPFGADPHDATACLRACGDRLACSASAGVSRGTAAANSPPWCLLRVTCPRTDSRGRCTPSQISS